MFTNIYQEDMEYISGAESIDWKLLLDQLLSMGFFTQIISINLMCGSLLLYETLIELKGFFIMSMWEPR